MLYLGTMSGTSMDGIDIAAIETDGDAVSGFGPVAQRAFEAKERALLVRAIEDAKGLKVREARPGALAEAEAMVTDAHVVLVAEFLRENEIHPESVSAVGFHGQTVLHRPEAQLTVQIGDGAALASRTGLRTVWDLRAADVAAGGQGAPLVPIYHRALVRNVRVETPCAVVNLGGVGNVSYVDGETLLAFDTGPANALVDDWMLRNAGVAMDINGATASKGRVQEDRIATALDAPYFALSPPKSVDRYDFDSLVDGLTEGLSVEDGAATLTAFSAACMARAVEHLPHAPETWVMTGGGARNPTFMAMLADRLPGSVYAASHFGWQTEHIEAQAFAYLAARSLRGLPLTFPGTTGIATPMTGGVVSEPASV
ncbi:MAG: anhydro-N-acetylmuramic acid kinase [Pseudomonadota bacterium]